MFKRNGLFLIPLKKKIMYIIKQVRNTSKQAPGWATLLKYFDRRTTEEHTNIGILRSSAWKFEVNPLSSLGGDVRSSILTDRQTDNGKTCKYRDLKK